MSGILLQNISFAYQGKLALDNLTLSIPAGSRLALMGASGSGKTTLLRLLAGLEHPQSGTITGLPGGGVSMVFQEDRLLPWLTAAENIQLTNPALTTAQAASFLEELGLGQEVHSFPEALSGGMSRRVAIARAVACGREVCLLDEPFNGLDDNSKRQTMDFILRHTKGKTLVMVTHDYQEAEYMGMEIFSFSS